MKKLQDDVASYDLLPYNLMQWFPTGGLRPKVGRGRVAAGVANSIFNSLLKARIFATAHINVVVCQQNQNMDIFL